MTKRTCTIAHCGSQPSFAKATEGSPRLAYSAEVAASATKAGSYGVFGEGE